jgi:hypothetical protein
MDGRHQASNGPPRVGMNRGTMKHRLLTSVVAALVAGLSAAYAAGTPVDQVSLTAASVPVAKLNVPCANTDAFAAANGLASDACGTASDVFPAALASAAPIAVLSGKNDSAATNIVLGDNLALNLGGATLKDTSLASLTPYAGSLQEEVSRPLAQATFAGVSWNVAPWASLSLIAAQSTADNPFDREALNSLTKASQSVSANASARLGDNWITTVSYSQSASQLNLRSATLLGDDDLLRGHGLGLSVAKRGLFGNNDSLDIGITRKLQSYTTAIDLTGDDGFGASLQGSNLTVPETDFEVGYVTTFLDGALALQANAAYQTNVAGQNDKNSLTVLSRAKFNF